MCSSSDAVELLRRARRKGFVYPPKNGWVSFVADGKAYATYEKIFAAVAPEMPLLAYMFVEDHGWNYFLTKNSDVYSFYACTWDPELEFDADNHSQCAAVLHSSCKR